MKKIKIAFIKYGGLTTGGSEKLLQIIAGNLPKDMFDVTYFYCDMAPNHYSIGASPTDPYRKKFLEDKGVNLVKFSVQEIDFTSPYLTWKGSTFWDVFKEKDYDMIQMCRAGHKEYPFTKIRKKPLLDIIALSSGSDNQYNIARVLHICQWSVDSWVRRGGDKFRTRLVSLPIAVEGDTGSNLRNELSIPTDTFIFGMHQRKSDDIFSPIPLEAYAKIETDKTAFIILAGSDLYRKQAKDLGIRHIYFLEQTGDSKRLFAFLRTLDVYAHGRKDGEVNSQAIAEAMYCGLPVVSHVSSVNNGHIECIGEAGNVVATINEYRDELKKLIENRDYFLYRQSQVHIRFKEHYELEGQIKRYVEIYKDVYSNPFPNKVCRFLVSIHYTQNIRVVVVWFYLKWKAFKFVID